MTYKLIKNPFTNKVDSVQLTNSTTNIILIIPFDEANSDYQEYLEWVAEGNTAEAAD
jgi:hypothetical protein